MAITLPVIDQDSPRRRRAHFAGEPNRARAVARAAAVAIAVTALLGAGAIWRTSPLDLIASGTAGGGAAAALRLPDAYTVLSPICEAYDALTLLTLGQHAALLAWLVAIFIGMRIVRALRRRSANIRTGSAWRALREEGTLFALLILGFAAVYAAGAVIPRPMAAIVLDDRDELAVDVHSHTAVSHDGRPGFDAEANRRWHAAAGFAAAYITDHRYFDGAVAGERANPRVAGDGTVLLSGIESVAPHSRITMLGARAAMGLDSGGRVDEARLTLEPEVVVVLTSPTSLSEIPASLRLDAIEASDGAPRGLIFTRRMAPAISRFAAGRNLALVAGSNNHGWGRTASAWTVLRIPGWRAMSPASLDAAIRSTLLHRVDAVRVVARGSVPLPLSPGAFIATPALVAWSVVTRLSGAERVSWLAWAWSATILLILLGRSRRGESAIDDALQLVPALPNATARGPIGRRRAAP